MSENAIEPCKGDAIRRSDAIKAYNDNLETSEVGTMLDDEKYLQALQSIPAVEPCEDAVSREKLFRTFVEDNSIGHYGEFMDGSDCAFTKREVLKTIKNAPSVIAETDIDDYMKGYDHGTADAWKIARIIFDSDVTLYEAMDVVKCMKGAKDD